MRANDLKFGNYVMISRTSEPCRISTITRHKIGYHTKEHENNLHYARFIEIEPIMINAGILKLYGMTKLDNENIYCHNDDDICYMVSFDAIGQMIFDGYKKGGSIKIHKIISHIHELQQCLSILDYERNVLIDDIKKELNL